MAKYHISENGPAVCTANKRPCPIGGDHFSDMNEATKVYAERMPAFNTLKQQTTLPLAVYEEIFPAESLHKFPAGTYQIFVGSDNIYEILEDDDFDMEEDDEGETERSRFAAAIRDKLDAVGPGLAEGYSHGFCTNRYLISEEQMSTFGPEGQRYLSEYGSNGTITLEKPFTVIEISNGNTTPGRGNHLLIDELVEDGKIEIDYDKDMPESYSPEEEGSTTWDQGLLLVQEGENPIWIS
jgi:hypothetical protein